jgi:hypothetical protein
MGIHSRGKAEVNLASILPSLNKNRIGNLTAKWSRDWGKAALHGNYNFLKNSNYLPFPEKGH